MKGTLALVGSGEYLPGMDPVDRALLSRLSEPARVVCLPTAAGTEGKARIDYWSDLGVGHFRQLGAQVEAVEVIDRASAQDVTLAERIGAANFVYLSGGKPAYLHQVLDGTPAWEAIQGVLERGGVVAGCSAGAMIFGEMILGFPGFQPRQAGFNYLPGVVIIPHFDEMPQGVVFGVRQLLPKAVKLVGVEGYTALVKQPDGYAVLGRGGVTVWDTTAKVRYQAGQQPAI